MRRARARFWLLLPLATGAAAAAIEPLREVVHLSDSAAVQPASWIWRFSAWHWPFQERGAAAAWADGAAEHFTTTEGLTDDEIARNSTDSKPATGLWRPRHQCPLGFVAATDRDGAAFCVACREVAFASATCLTSDSRLRLYLCISVLCAAAIVSLRSASLLRRRPKTASVSTKAKLIKLKTPLAEQPPPRSASTSSRKKVSPRRNVSRRLFPNTPETIIAAGKSGTRLEGCRSSPVHNFLSPPKLLILRSVSPAAVAHRYHAVRGQDWKLTVSGLQAEASPCVSVSSEEGC